MSRFFYPIFAHYFNYFKHIPLRVFKLKTYDTVPIMYFLEHIASIIFIQCYS